MKKYTLNELIEFLEAEKQIWVEMHDFFGEKENEELVSKYQAVIEELKKIDQK